MTSIAVVNFKDNLRTPSYWAVCSFFALSHIAVFFILNKISLEGMGWLMSLLVNLIVPFGILLIISASPRHISDCIVHFRIKNPLPGCEAFSRLAKIDARISTEKIKAKYGRLPLKRSKEQNARWYSIYQTVKQQPEVVIAQRKYLIFRDLAIVHFSAIISWILISVFYSPIPWQGWMILIFLYILLIFASKNTGERFVQTVLAITQ